MINGVRDAIVQLDQRMDRRIDAIDRRFDATDRRFDAIDRRFEAVEHRLDGLDTKISHQFMWTVGIQVTTLVAIAAALLAK